MKSDSVPHLLLILVYYDQMTTRVNAAWGNGMHVL